MEGRAPILPSILHHLVLHPAVALSRRGFFIKLTNCRTGVGLCNDRASSFLKAVLTLQSIFIVQITPMWLRINLQTQAATFPIR